MGVGWIFVSNLGLEEEGVGGWASGRAVGGRADGWASGRAGGRAEGLVGERGDTTWPVVKCT